MAKSDERFLIGTITLPFKSDLNIQTKAVKSLKNSVLRFLFLLCVLGSTGFYSCSSRKTSQLVPDSCRGLVQINMPSLAAKLLLNKELLDSIRNQVGFNLKDMGLDFFQNAYVFEKVEEGLPERYFLFGLSDPEKFSQALHTKWPDLKLENHGQNTVVYFSRFCLVWDQKFAIGRYCNPMLPKIDPDHMLSMLSSTLSADRNFNLIDSSDVSFRWIVNEPAALALLPPFECNVSGTAALHHFTISLNAQMEERQYFAFLNPFKTRQIPYNFGGLKVEFLPALNPIWQQYYSLSGKGSDVDDQMGSVVESLADVDAPYTLFIPENGIGDPVHQAQFWAEFKTEISSRQLHQNLSSQLKPYLDYNRDSLSLSGHEIVLHPFGQRPVFWSRHFVDPSNAQKPDENHAHALFPEDIFSVVLKNEKARFVFEIGKLGHDTYRIGIESANFHQLRLPQFFDRLEKGVDGFVPPILP